MMLSEGSATGRKTKRSQYRLMHPQKTAGEREGTLNMIPVTLSMLEEDSR